MGVSNIEEDNIETAQADGSDSQISISQDEPHTDRESLKTDAFAEGIEDSVIEELSAKETVTIEDLRKLPGTEGLTDQQLTAAWDKAQKDAGGEGADQKIELPFPVYDAQGNKVASDKVTLGDLLNGKLQIGYNAMGKEQRKTFEEIRRNASQGHWNEHRYNTVQSQFKETTQKLTAAEKELSSARDMQAQWNSALTAISMGDPKPMAAIVNAYKASLGKTGIAPEGFVPQDQVEAQRADTERGMQWWTDVGMPSAYEIAANYKADPKEVSGAIKWYLENEPSLTPQRIEEIIKFDVPMLLEANGYNISGNRSNNQSSGNGQTNEVAELRKQLEAQAGKIAEMNNGRTNAIREKGKKIPAAGSGSTPGAGDSMPTFKNRAQMKEWLQGSDS